MYYHKKVFLISILFILCSCQSNLQKIGVKHKTTIEKWYELAKFSESDLNTHNIKLIASLTEGNVVQLSHFRVSVSEGFSDVNLLSPTIEHKYICKRYCKHLSQLITAENNNRGVLFDFYFDQSEFELFKFYGDLYLLNDNLTFLNEFPNSLFDKYVTFLAEQNLTFSNLNEFMVYLKSVLNRQAFLAFLNEPDKRFRALSLAPKEEENWAHEHLADSFLADNGETIETELWASIELEGLESSSWVSAESDNTQILNWISDESNTSESLIWASDELVNSEHASWTNDELVNPESLLWHVDQVTNAKDLAKFTIGSPNLDLFIGDLVCHGLSNSFGLVEAITGKQVMVQLVGELITYKDGVTVKSKPNEILFESGNIDFLRLNQKQQYLVNDLQKCDLFNGDW